MNLITKTVAISYVVLLSVIMGFALFSGVVVAPVLFNSITSLGEPILNRFQEGLLMTSVFVRLSYPLVVVCLVSLVYELFQYLKKSADWLALISMILMVVTGLLFVFYFVPAIVHMQERGPLVTQSAAFSSIHKASEICFKITVISGIVLAVRNILKLIR
ncbi:MULTISPECIES: DUF4149 domain-containing protein [Vibrio]|uniref:TMEM205-like domain-containing protein n=1 Tax=Vibrio halioticoli NBRC 102217 TaxID=1219072 RepID=V5F1I2_9VIBR|nr:MULTISPECIES: DUF4149 domain-containing protein [Vibrio]GAD88964.1 hypothetical protein VHA01S_013_00010 [Vibrio halioticoli NBRC 102217]